MKPEAGIINSTFPHDTMWNLVNIGSGIGFLSGGTKQLAEQMLTQVG